MQSVIIPNIRISSCQQGSHRGSLASASVALICSAGGLVVAPDLSTMSIYRLSNCLDDVAKKRGRLLNDVGNFPKTSDEYQEVWDCMNR